MKIDITTTVETVEQAQQLLEAGVDTIYFGEEDFGLRLPCSFTRKEQKALVDLAHQYDKKATIAVNAIMHPEKMKLIPDYLRFLEEIQVDQITIGDPGVIYRMNEDKIKIPYIYDGQTLVTSSRQINFWGKKGAIGAVVAREVPYLELKQMAEELSIYGEILVYGATCIHQSKRPLVRNFFSYIEAEDEVGKDRGLFLSEPKKEDTHYSIYEDCNGTHIFADNDVNLMLELDKLIELSYGHWKLDGIYTSGDNFVEIAKEFIAAKAIIEKGLWSYNEASKLNEKVKRFHPTNRELDTGFFLMDPDEVK